MIGLLVFAIAWSFITGSWENRLEAYKIKRFPESQTWLIRDFFGGFAEKPSADIYFQASMSRDVVMKYYRDIFSEEPWLLQEQGLGDIPYLRVVDTENGLNITLMKVQESSSPPLAECQTNFRFIIKRSPQI